MNNKERAVFITELIESVRQELLGKHYPENWDGIELRWLVASKFQDCVLGGYKDKREKRYREYEKVVLTNNY